jgi:hypothetical protein
MAELKNITVTSSDILAAIALHAQRIVAVTGQFAAGAPFPDPNAIAGELARMTELNDALKVMQQATANSEAA